MEHVWWCGDRHEPAKAFSWISDDSSSRQPAIFSGTKSLYPNYCASAGKPVINFFKNPTYVCINWEYTYWFLVPPIEHNYPNFPLNKCEPNQCGTSASAKY